MFGNMPITYLVKHLLIINVLFFFGTLIILGSGNPAETDTFTRDWLALYMPGSPNFRPYQIATHMFMHGDLGHLFFNMFSLYMFGSQIEMIWGPQKLLMYYIICGLGAAALQIAVNYWSMTQAGTPLDAYFGAMWGASGAIWGLYAAYAYNFPNNKISLLFPPITLTAKWFVLILGALELTYGVSGNMTGIAHFAHIGGGLVGLLVIWYWGGFRGTGRKWY